MYLRQSWRDKRLIFDATNRKSKEIRLGEGSWNDIWVPDTFFRNEKRASFHEVTVNNRLLRLNSSGHLWYVIKWVSKMPAAGVYTVSKESKNTICRAAGRVHWSCNTVDEMICLSWVSSYSQSSENCVYFALSSTRIQRVNIQQWGIDCIRVGFRECPRRNKT
jgi:Neurotransmitter-gated ion-channel ligand binding domain